MTVGSLLADARRRLAAAPHRPPPREAYLLLGRVLGLSEAELLTRDRMPVAPAAAERFGADLARRLAGEPVAYIVGEKEFYGRAFRVDRRVLVPRPETEHLVEAALSAATGRLATAARVLDIGTGSGAIAVTLALERPGWRVVASDLSPGALAVARDNARRLGAPVAFVAADLGGAFDLAPFDLVVSNPPYISRAEAPELSVEVIGFEPAGALFAPDLPAAPGAGVVARLLDQARSLHPTARVICEIGHRQRPAVEVLAAERGWEIERVVADYGGIDRVVVLARREGADDG